MKILRDDFFRYRFLSDIKHSPNGPRACFVVAQPEPEANLYNYNLWLYNGQDKTRKQLTAGNEERLYTWAADGSEIFFVGGKKRRQDVSQESKDSSEAVQSVVYKISVDGGEAREMFRVPLQIKKMQAADDDTIFFSAVFDPEEEQLQVLAKTDQQAAVKQRKDSRAYEVLEEIPFWSNGQGFTSGHRTRLYRFQQKQSKLDVLTSATMDVSDFDVSADGSHAAVIGQEFRDKSAYTRNLFLLNLGNDTMQPLLPEPSWDIHGARFVNTGELLFAAAARKHYGLNENPDWYRLNLDTKEMTQLTKGFDRTIWNSVGSDCRLGAGEPLWVDGGRLYYVTTAGHYSFLESIDASGHIHRHTGPGGSVDSFSVKDENILFVGLRGTALQELWEVTAAGEEQRSTFNDWVSAKRRVLALEPLSVEVTAGERIDGWVIVPPHAADGRADTAAAPKHPGILNIHGGPKTVYSDVFFHEMQVLAHEGHFVFFCNPRGSDGRGNQFADIRGRYGTIDYDDLMAFTDAVLKKYPALDGSRLGVSGGSYGGFMTNWIIGHTNRFQAAVSQRSISNWISKFGTTDIGYFFNADQIGATPWDDTEKLWEHSPLKYAASARTPTLFIHAEEDYRCWLPEGLQMFTALKYHGVASRLVMFRGENHELSRSGRPQQRLRRLDEIRAWFEKYLEPNKQSVSH